MRRKRKSSSDDRRDVALVDVSQAMSGAMTAGIIMNSARIQNGSDLSTVRLLRREVRHNRYTGTDQSPCLFLISRCAFLFTRFEFFFPRCRGASGLLCASESRTNYRSIAGVRRL